MNTHMAWWNEKRALMKNSIERVKDSNYINFHFEIKFYLIKKEITLERS
jgi:hypothetical protein